QQDVAHEVGTAGVPRLALGIRRRPVDPAPRLVRIDARLRDGQGGGLLVGRRKELPDLRDKAGEEVRRGRPVMARRRERDRAVALQEPGGGGGDSAIAATAGAPPRERAPERLV